MLTSSTLTVRRALRRAVLRVWIDKLATFVTILGGLVDQNYSWCAVVTSNYVEPRVSVALLL